jgi:hypothetical protein
VEFGDIVSVGTKVIYSKVGDGQGNVLPGALAEERQLVKSQVAYDSLAIGIVSNNYGDFTSTGLDLIDPADHPMPVALSGRVPVKISPSSEPIMAGDYVTTSSDPGKAMKAVGPGQTIGKALEDWTPGSGKTQIRVFVNMSQGNSFDLQQNPQGDIADGVQWQDDVLSLQGDITMSGNMNVGGNGMIHGNLTVTGTASIGELYVANAIVTGNLTVGGTITTGKLVVNHLVTAGDAPTIAAGAAACENPTVAIEGNDTAGMITVTTGQLAIGQVACGSGVLVQITFHEAFDAAPRVTLTAAEANAAGFTQVFVDSTTATGASFDLDSIIPPAPQKTYKWYYQAMQ